jgi:hypothetical protein
MANDIVKKTRSFWDTKEGGTGMFVGAGLLALLGWGAYKIMPYVASLMENTFYAIAFGLAAIALVYVTVIDGTLRNRLWLMYKLLMRALTYSIIKYDPFGVLRELQAQAKERIRKVQACREQVKSQLRIIGEAIKGFASDMTDVRGRIRYLEGQGAQQSKIDNETSKLGQLDGAVKELTASQTLITDWYAKLKHAQEALETIDSNIDFKINLEERKYKAVAATNTAWRLVRDAFKGQTEEDQLRTQTLDFIAEDYGTKLGEIDVFMEESEKFIDAVDMQNAINTEKGRSMLENLNRHELPSAIQSLTNNPSASITDVVGTPVKSGSSIDYLNIRK